MPPTQRLCPTSFPHPHMSRFGGPDVTQALECADEVRPPMGGVAAVGTRQEGIAQRLEGRRIGMKMGI